FVSAFCWVGADHPPKIDGKNLALDFELKIPPAIQLPAELSDYNVRASLYANNRDNRYAKIDINSIRKIEGFTIIPGTAELMSSSANRQLLASIGNEPGPSQFVEINLPARPRKENEEWSNWTFATEHADLTPVADPERISVRYRVRVVD